MDNNMEELEVVNMTSEEVDSEESLNIEFKKPFLFEGKEYTGVDLSGLEDLSGADMVAVNKIMNRSGANTSVMPEISLEYAFNLAARAAKLPVEFFMALPVREAMKVKSRVMGFLFN